MKRLMICFVLLMALFVYAVPTDVDVGDGYSVAIDESDDAIVIATQLEWPDDCALGVDYGDSRSYSYMRQMEQDGCLSDRIVPPDIALNSSAISYKTETLKFT